MDEEDYMNQEAGPSGASGKPTSAEQDSNQPMSKKAMKRAAKQARLEAQKPEKRKAEKIRRKENAHKLAEGYKAGTLTEEENARYEARKANRAARSQVRKKEDKGQVQEWGGGVVIDLDFDELMNEQEIKSMASQIGYVYSVNRLAERPFKTILHTSFSPERSPRIWEKMSKTARVKWGRCFWQEGGIDSLAKKFGESSTAPQTAESEQELELPPSISPKTHRLVYLSADSQNELDSLSEDEIYIIGGIVDRNRYKNLCQDKAEKYGIKTARLPIGTYLANLPTRKVLTVNQVFAILVEYISRQSWSEAFEAVIPQRKFETESRKRRRNKDGTEAGSADAESNVNPGLGSDDEGAELDEATGSIGEEGEETAPFDGSRSDGGDQDENAIPIV